MSKSTFLKLITGILEILYLGVLVPLTVILILIGVALLVVAIADINGPIYVAIVCAISLLIDIFNK